MQGDCIACDALFFRGCYLPCMFTQAHAALGRGFVISSDGYFSFVKMAEN